MKNRIYLSAVLASMIVLGCGSSDTPTATPTATPAPTPTPTPTPSALNLSIVHVNDTHSHLDSETMKLKFDGVTTYAEVGGYGRMKSKIDALQASKTHSLTLNAGDIFQGTLYYSLFKGEADAAMMNTIKWDGYTLGNHAFDDGDANLATFLSQLTKVDNILAANIEVPKSNPLTGLWKPYFIKEFKGEKVGVIGIGIVGKTKNSSNPSDEVIFHDEVETMQKYIEELKAKGVNKVVMLSHVGLGYDKEFVSKLSGVDVVIGGDSHSLMGDFSAVGLTSHENSYPLEVTDKDGSKVCIAQAWEYAHIVGALDVNFDKEGVVTSCEGTPILMLGNTFKQKDTEGNKVEVDVGVEASILETINNNKNLEIVEEDASVLSVLQSFKDEVDEKKNISIGSASQRLGHNRIPGDNKDGGGALPLGSDIAPIVAKSFYDLSNLADACIQNAGGVRVAIEEGEITMGDAYTLLPFANTLFEIEMTGAEVKQVLEDAVEEAIYGGEDKVRSTGAFPYAYALKYDVKTDKEFGQRVQNLEIKDRATGTWSMINHDKMYTIVTNSYIASGKDGYTTFKTVQDERGKGVDTFLDYALSFVRYVESRQEAGKSVEILPASEHCIKSYGTSTDFRVTPYVQNPAKDAMTVMWLSNSDQSGTLTVDGRSLSSTAVKSDDLAYHPSEIESFFIENTKPPYLHKIRVDGLVEGTTYTYKVMQNGSEFNSSFGTSPSEDSNISFIVYADSETEPESTGRSRRNSEPYGDFDRKYWIDQTDGYANNIEVMKAFNPDFIAIAGDLVEAGNEQRDWDEFWKHNSGKYNNIASSVPLFPAVGNHENHSGGKGGGGFYTTPLAKAAVARYREYFETPDNGTAVSVWQDRFYRVDYGPITYITLDVTNGGPNASDKDTNWYLLGYGETSTEHPEWGAGEAPDFNPGSAQYQWLEEQLEDAQKNSRFIFVQFHHIPYSVGPHGFPTGDAGIPNGEDKQSGVPVRILTPLFKKYGVDAVFAAHDEMYERSVVDSIHFYDIGIGGDGLRGPYMGEDGKYDLPSNNPYQQFIAHLDAPETWDGNKLISGGKHYGHLAVNVFNEHGSWKASLDPVYVFPLMDNEGNVTRDENTGRPKYERRSYDDKVELVRLPGDVDGDGDVDSDDRKFAQEYIGQDATECRNCDVNSDGNINLDDIADINDSCTRNDCATLGLGEIGAYETNLKDASEIVAYDKASKRMFVTNAEENKIDIISISDSANPSKVSSIDLSTYGTGVNSVAVKDTNIAVAIEIKDDNKTHSKGKVVFFDADGTHKNTVTVGYLPDMLTFNEDGSKVIVANEGEPNKDYSFDPIGSIGIITIADASYVDINFSGVSLTDASDGTAVRLGSTPSNDQAKDLEPEYVTVSGNYAYVTLQENNAMAKVNLTTNAIEYVKSYGAKSWETDSNNTIDIHEEGVLNMKSYKGLFGLYQSDSISSYQANGKTYLVTANEGDGREYGDFEDEKKISKLNLDSSIESEYVNENDLKVMVDLGDTDNDGDYDKLYTYGARSFSIWDDSGDLVFDSGDDIGKKVAQYEPELFNHSKGKIDKRSGNKGAEPEAITVGTIGEKTYAFVGLERQNAIMVYDVTNPEKSKFVNYIGTDDDTGKEGHISPEGMRFISASESPNGKNLLLVSFEVSGSTVVYEVK